MNSCLDHIFIKTHKPNSNEIRAGVIQTSITDHFSTFTAVQLSSRANYDNSFIKKNINYNLLCTLLKQENWSILNKTINVNDLIDIFYTKLNSSIEKSSYVVKFYSKNKCIKEWMTKGLLTSARRKNEISRKVRKHPNNLKLREYYIKYQNHIITILRARKISFYKLEFSNISTNPKLT